MADIVYLTFHDNITLESANRVMDFTAKAITHCMETTTYTAEQEAEMLCREESHFLFLDFKRASITPGKLQAHSPH